ncbi:DUF1993 family protein [Rhizobium sp. G21]|uniref:DUF1993 domain-containing protein n=1 Tax=Rhizobium sp. G21 TaxID=2758439 RepID=UPI0015FF0289|nr:DUF1993 domain-containing protein [Rhizobium sp. G21]MBB1249833.1 DUF1993 domain-containing protein [Rhizobium sp. G21]
MTLTLHAVAAGSVLPRLKGLSTVLAKASVHCREHGLAEQTILGDRLAADMFDLTRQVQIATDHTKSMLYRVTGQDVPSLPDTETSFAELQARIEKAKALFEAVDADAVNARTGVEFEVKFPWATMSFTGASYLLQFGLPNFYFHVATAYDIVRKNDVKIGKSDFLGA